MRVSGHLRKTGYYPGDLLIAAVVLLPLLWAAPGLLAALGTSWTAVTSLLVRTTGILALSTFVAAALLSARVPRTDRWFGGQMRLWEIHKLLGFSAFLLVMAHVLLLALMALPVSVERSVTFIFPPMAQWDVWAGWLAFVLMVVFIAPTFGFFGRLHYQRWKSLHRISAPAFLLALVHGIALAPGAAIWWLLGVLALAAIAWRLVFSRPLARQRYTVDSVTPLARDVVEINLKPLGRGMTWQPGQFVYLSPLDPQLEAGIGEEHPYTIASADSDTHMRIGVKAIGDATTALQHVRPGTEAEVEGPYGTFLEAHEPDRGRLWLGGGIGITPFVAGARAMRTGTSEAVDTVSLYLADRPERAYYLDELKTIAEATPTFTAHVHYFNEHGVLTADFLRAHCPDFAEREVFICGPPGMIAHVDRLLRDEGVPPERIHTEAFDFL